MMPVKKSSTTTTSTMNEENIESELSKHLKSIVKNHVADPEQFVKIFKQVLQIEKTNSFDRRPVEIVI